MTPLNLHTGHISEEKCIVGRCHLACRRELAEGDQSFRARCESNVRRRFPSLFRIALSVKRPVMLICNIRETGQFSSKGIISDFIGNLNRLTVLRLITESAAIQ